MFMIALMLVCRRLLLLREVYTHTHTRTHTHTHTHTGLVLESFKAFARQRDGDFFLEAHVSGNKGIYMYTISTCPLSLQNTAVTNCVGLLENCIQMAACGPKEMLPMHPSLPADLFTACLTTPIKAALLWYCYSRVGKLSLVSGITPEMIDKYVLLHVSH